MIHEATIGECLSLDDFLLSLTIQRMWHWITRVSPGPPRFTIISVMLLWMKSMESIHGNEDNVHDFQVYYHKSTHTSECLWLFILHHEDPDAQLAYVSFKIWTMLFQLPHVSWQFLQWADNWNCLGTLDKRYNAGDDKLLRSLSIQNTHLCKNTNCCYFYDMYYPRQP